MCRMASFFFLPKEDDFQIKVAVLDSHSGTEEKLKLNKNVWREGHYLPDGTIECRVLPEDSMTMEECNNIVKGRYGSFVQFFNWAVKECGAELAGAAQRSGTNIGRMHQAAIWFF